MANSYYNVTGNPAQNALAASATQRSEFALIAAGFALLPTLGAGAANQLVTVNSSGTALTVSSYFDIPQGTAALPSIGFIGDTTTGLYQSAVGHWSVSISGTQRLDLSASTLQLGTSSILEGTLGYSDTGALMGLQGSSNSYQQSIVQNTSNGAAASADFIVSNNLGTASTYYGDFGINSSTFSGTGSMALPNATYVYSYSGDLVLGTQTANAIHFVVNNGATDAGTVGSAGNWTINAPSSGNTFTIIQQGANTGLVLGSTGNATNGSVSHALTTAGHYVVVTNVANTNCYFGGGTSTSGTVINYGAGNNGIALNSTGNVTINPPGSGNTLNITAQGTYSALGLSATGNTTNGSASIGFNSTGNLFISNNITATATYIGSQIAGGYGVVLTYAAGVAGAVLSGTGTFSINAPASGNNAFVATQQGTAPLMALSSTNNATNGSGTLFFGSTGNMFLTNTTVGGSLIMGASVAGGGGVTLTYGNSVAGLALNGTGNVTINAPSSGTALTVTAVSSVAALFNGSQIQVANIGSDSAIDLKNNTVTTGREYLLTSQSAGSFAIYDVGAAAVRLSISGTGNVTINAPSSGTALTVSGVSGTHSTKIADSATNSFNAGFLEVPQNLQTANYTCVLADSGKGVDMNGTSLTVTIPANASVAYPVGTVLTFTNLNASALSIAITTDTMTKVNSTSTGTRTLAQNGIATARKVGTTSWIISGSGLS